VTLDSVLIWDCTIPSASPSPRVLSLPYPIKTSDQLPLAWLVSSASKELGVVLVYPTSGKITFWEDIDSAESLKLFEQRRHGVEGTLKLSGGEVVEDIIDVESAGLVLLTSAGRLAHLTLQDAVGQPQVAVNFLLQPSKGSFFGDLVHVFQPNSRNRLNAVKTRPVAKGRVEIVSLSNDGLLKIWEVREAGQSTFFGDIASSADIKDALCTAQLLDPLAKSSLKFMDLAIFNSTSTNDWARNSEPGTAPIHALLLVQIDKSGASQLYILDTIVASGKAIVSRIFPITIYHPPPNTDSRSRLLLPVHGHTAFIIHEKAVVIVSIPAKLSRSAADATPELPSFYQDVILFKTDVSSRIIAAAPEVLSTSAKQHRRPESNVLLFTKPAGMLRISTQLYNGQGSDSRFRLPTALNKMEQAVFFGGVSDNILDLFDLANFSYSSAELEAAALALSARILRTETDYLPQTAPAMESHLLLRMRAMQDLAEFLKKHCPPLSRSSKWKLLGDAERLASARAMWKKHDSQVSHNNSSVTSLLEEGVDRALERHKQDTGSQDGDVDDVRLWFTKELGRLERLFPYCISLIKERSESGQLHTSDFLQLAPEMNALIITGLQTAYVFRQEHMAEYGLEMEHLEDGVLAEGYKELPRFWTADKDVIKSVSWAIKLTHDIVSTVLNADMQDAPQSMMDQIDSLAQDMDQVIRISCKSHIEGYRWLMAQSNPEEQQQGLHMKTHFESEIRRDQISYLYSMGQAQRGLSLAEDLKDIQALVELSLLELDEQKSRQRRTAGGLVHPSSDLDRIEKQIGHYIQKFGRQFAGPFHEKQVASHRLGDLIDKNLGSKELRTEFLRSDPSYGKIAWINEVLNEDDMIRATQSLTKVAGQRETNVWSRKLELSIAKLALKCLPAGEDSSVGIERPNPSDITNSAFAEQNARGMVLVSIQEQLYGAIRPAITESIDEQAAIDNVMQLYGNEYAESHPSLAQVLKLCFADLISHRSMSAESLIDVLTLMQQPLGEHSLNGKEIYYALKVLEAASGYLGADATDTLRRLIWKRCLVSEDWAVYGQTADTSDDDFKANLRLTLTFRTIQLGIQEG
jgi:nuclear pore complex protein Nup133